MVMVGGTHDQRYIIDGGFLELVRLGVMSANDWTILETIPEYDEILKQTITKDGVPSNLVTVTRVEPIASAIA